MNDDDWLLKKLLFSAALYLTYLTLDSQVFCHQNESAVLKGLTPFFVVPFYGGFFFVAIAFYGGF